MATNLRRLIQDTAYVTVGLGVLAFQKAQVRRREARARLEHRVEDARHLASDARGRITETAKEAREKLAETRGKVESTAQEQVKAVLDRIEPVAGQLRSRVEPLADQVQERLPEPIAKAVAGARSRLQSKPTATTAA